MVNIITENKAALNFFMTSLLMIKMTMTMMMMTKMTNKR